MTPIADMVAKMLAARSPVDAIVEAVRAMEGVTLASRDVSRSVTRDTVKEQARNRQRARRERIAAQRKLAEAQANDGAAVTVTVTRDASRDGVTIAPLLSSTSCLFPEVVIEKENKKARSENVRARGQRMVAGAMLTSEYEQAAIDLGARLDDIPKIWAEFVDYWVAIPGARGLKTDWLATWRNRVRTILNRGTPNGQRTRQSLSDLASDIADEARRRGH